MIYVSRTAASLNPPYNEDRIIDVRTLNAEERAQIRQELYNFVKNKDLRSTPFLDELAKKLLDTL